MCEGWVIMFNASEAMNNRRLFKHIALKYYFLGI